MMSTAKKMRIPPRHQAICAAALALASLLTNKTALAEGSRGPLGVAVPPTDRQALPAQPPSEANQQLASSFVNGATGVLKFLNNYGLQAEVERAIKVEDLHIKDLLESTGMQGCLVYVPVESSITEFSSRQLVSGRVNVVGAGTSPEDVEVSMELQTRVSTSPDKGYTQDLDGSFYLWFGRGADGKLAPVRMIPGRIMTGSVNRQLSDKLLIKTLRPNLTGRALQAAVDKIASDVRYRESNEPMSNVVRQQKEIERKLVDINRKLSEETDRAQKATQVSNLFSGLSAALSLGGQISMIVTYMGEDSTPAIKNASSESQLNAAIKDVEVDAIQKRNVLLIDKKTYLDALSKTKVDEWLIIRSSKFPLEVVPQLQIQPQP